MTDQTENMDKFLTLFLAEVPDEDFIKTLIMALVSGSHKATVIKIHPISLIKKMEDICPTWATMKATPDCIVATPLAAPVDVTKGFTLSFRDLVSVPPLIANEVLATSSSDPFTLIHVAINEMKAINLTSTVESCRHWKRVIGFLFEAGNKKLKGLTSAIDNSDDGKHWSKAAHVACIIQVIPDAPLTSSLLLNTQAYTFSNCLKGYNEILHSFRDITFNSRLHYADPETKQKSKSCWNTMPEMNQRMIINASSTSDSIIATELC